MTWDKQKLRDGPEPRWLQISQRLRTDIVSGHFGPGECLPSESELNKVFGVSRTTARAALDKLRHEGLITRQSGKGSIVTIPYVEQPLSSLSSFSEDMAARGLKANYDTQRVALEHSPDEVCDSFGLPSGAKLLHIKRCLLADDAIIGLSQSWITPNAMRSQSPLTIEELDRGSLYEWLEVKCKQRIAGGTETIEAGIADKTLAKALDTKKGSAVLIARRRATNATGLLIEYAVITYRSDRYRFTLEMNRAR